VANAFLLEWNHHWHCSSTTKENKGYYCGVCVQNTGDSEQVYKQAGQSQNVIGKLLLNVLSQTGYHGAHTNKKGGEMQNLIIGMSHL
jgi:hypothetical protein